MNLKRSILSAGCAAAALASALTIAQPNASLSARLLAASLDCNLSQYKAAPGLTAAIEQDQLVVTWAGQAGSEVRARYGIENGQPIVRDLAVRKQGGQWATLGQHLSPEYHVVSGLRRMSSDHVGSLPAAGIPLTPEVVAKNRW